MATGRIESGQVMLRAPQGGVPMQQIQVQQVDPVGLRAQAQTANTLAQVLDRMSGSIFQQAGQAAQEQAIADVANSPISDEQLQAAKQGDVSLLNIGGKFSMYDIALRKARSFELAGRFDQEAKSEAVKILADIDAGTITSQQAAQKLNVMTAGYGKSLASVDADAALKFNASMGVYGSTIVAKAYEQEVRRRKEKEAMLLDSSFADDMKLVNSVIDQGVYTNANGETRSSLEFLDVYRKNLSDRAFTVGGVQLAQAYVQKFDKAVQEQKINVLTKFYIGESGDIDANKIVDRMKNGDAGKLSHILRDMVANDFDSVVKIEAQVYAASGHRHQAEQQKREDARRAAESSALNLMTQVYALPDGDPKRVALTKQIASIARNAPGSVPFGVVKDLLSPNQDSNQQVLFNTKDAIFSGKITSSEQIWEQTKSGLSQKDAVSLVSLFYSEDRKDAATLERGLAKMAGINVTPGVALMIDPKGSEAQRLSELRSRALAMQSKAAAKGESITTTEILRTIEDEVFKEKQTNEATEARNTLARYRQEKSWIGGEITRDRLNALEIKYKDDRNKMQEIKRMKTLLDKSEGIK